MLPVGRGSKAPLIREWQRGASTDAGQIQRWFARWPEANVGVAMGPSSGIVDLECDSPAAEELLRELFGGGAIATPTFASTRGVHRLFRWSAELPGGERATWRLGEIDFKVGGGAKGSQSVFPPSLHASGQRYEWVKGLSPAEVEPAEIDPATLERIRAALARSTARSTARGPVLVPVPREPARPSPPVTTARSADYWETILRGVAEGAGPAGGRANAAISLAGKWVRDLDLSDAARVEARGREFAEWNQRNQPPLAEGVVQRTWLSALTLERSRRSRDRQARYGVGPRMRETEGGTSEEPAWRAVFVSGVPPRWKLFAPLWDGFVDLTMDEWMNSRFVEKAVLIQKRVSFDCDFGVVWNGGRKEKRGLRQKLADASTTEEPGFEDCRDRVVAHLIWSQHLANAIDADEPELSGRPRRLPDGSLWFKTEYLLTNNGSLKDYPDRREINEVLRGCGIIDRMKRHGPKVAKYRVLSAAGVLQLAELAHRGAIE